MSTCRMSAFVSNGSHVPPHSPLLLQPSKPPAKAAAAAAAVKRPPPKRPAGAITLGTLLEEGLLRAGPEALSMEYKGTLTFAALTEDGRILWEGEQGVAAMAALHPAVMRAGLRRCHRL
jgi:hypothetical protein